MEIIELNEKFANNMVRIENGRVNEAVFAAVMDYYPSQYLTLIESVFDASYRYVREI